jgi:hypothetical protein
VLRHSSTAAPLLLGLVVSLLLTSCQWYGWRPKEREPAPPRDAPTRIVPIELGQRVEAEIRCSKTDCNHWYRVPVPEAGELEARVERVREGDQPLVRVAIQRIAGQQLDLVVSQTGPPLQARARVEPGAYHVLVQSLSDVNYALEIQLAPPSEEPAPDPGPFIRCNDPRPQMCTREYRPVCAQMLGGARQTYANGCEACADVLVNSWHDGECR